MIIVSQNRKMIVNFKNITVIGTCIQKQEEIGSRTINGDSQILGEYKTEERAKEVLQEIIELYSCYNKLIDSEGIKGIYQIPKIYKMPKE